VGDLVLDFGTSGRLYNSDLVMYDRQTKSLWPQFEGRAVVGELIGTELEVLGGASTVPWAAFRDAHPDGRVLSRDTGFDRPYGQNPYVGYDAPGNPPSPLFIGRVDTTLPPMERILAVDLGGEVKGCDRGGGRGGDPGRVREPRLHRDRGRDHGRGRRGAGPARRGLIVLGSPLGGCSRRVERLTPTWTVRSVGPTREAAFLGAVEGNLDRLFSTAYRLTRDRAEAKELVRETLLRAWAEPWTPCRSVPPPGPARGHRRVHVRGGRLPARRAPRDGREPAPPALVAFLRTGPWRWGAAGAPRPRAPRPLSSP
jgi:hypothetical protein